MPTKGTAPADELTPESLGWQLRAALPPMRLHSVSLCDAEGDVLWLSEGVLGPDEHGFALEAINTLSADPSMPGIESDLEDGRAAVFLPVRAPQGAIVGIAMILIDSKAVTRGLAARLVTPQVRTVLQRVAVLLKPAPTPQVNGRPVDIVSVAVVTEARANGELTLAPEETQPVLKALHEEPPPPPKAKTPPPPPRKAAPPPAPRAPTPRAPAPPPKPLPTLTSEQIDTILTVELTEEHPAIAEPPAPQQVNAAPAQKSKRDRSPTRANARTAADPSAGEPTPRTGPAKDLALSVQQLLKLRSGGRTRRYEVLLRARHDAERNELPHTIVQQATREIGEVALDEFVVTELLEFLAAHRAVWETEPSSFSVNLSTATIADENFSTIVKELLHRTGVAAEVLGFEIPQSCCVHEPQHVERFVNACDRLGCFIVLDDFTLDPRSVPLLRSRSLKLVKIDPKLTTAAVKDRVSQALVVAIAQASKVLGVHCVAKRVESQATREWLSGTGIDFAQGFALEGPQPLEALAAQKPAD